MNKIAGVLTPVILGAATAFFALKRYRFDREKARYERDTDVLKWVQECMGVIGDIEIFSVIPDKYLSSSKDRAAGLSKAISKLSILVDFGRMHFPNHFEGEYGVHKESAFRGIRHPILDALLEFHDLALRNLREEKMTEWADLNRLRREFVSHVQEAIEPRRRIQFLSKEAYVQHNRANGVR